MENRKKSHFLNPCTVKWRKTRFLKHVGSEICKHLKTGFKQTKNLEIIVYELSSLSLQALVIGSVWGINNAVHKFSQFLLP
jgi:hypothetical protein